MSNRINLNADIAEGHGAYDIGNDPELMKVIKSASIACGFHAGDHNTMHRLVMLAKKEGVSIGVHPGFNDLWGFGRREIKMKTDDIEYMTAYQIGALQAMARYGDIPVTHLKAHGALANMAAVDDGYAMAIAKAVKMVAPDLIFVALAGSAMERAAHKLNLRFAREGFADRQYDDDGNLVPRSQPGSVFKDGRQALEQALRMVTEKAVVTRSGKRIKVEVETICLHGDEPTAVQTANEVRKGLEAAGVKIVTIPEMLS